MLAATTITATATAMAPTWVSRASCCTWRETPSTVRPALAACRMLNVRMVRSAEEDEAHTADLGVVIAALFMWLAPWESRFYADPGVSVLIGIIIFAGSVPLSELFRLCRRLHVKVAGGP